MDKIFDNKFNEIENDYKNIKFKIETDEDTDVENRIYSEILFKKIDELINNHEIFSKFNEVKEGGKVITLTKSDMNMVYSYVIKNIKDYNIIDIFAAVSDYFDIQPIKFYNSLSSVYKEKLILELDKKFNILEKKKIRRLF